jgi:hypothetical protein
VTLEIRVVLCPELVGKVVSTFTLYEDGSDGPEICIEFSDGTVFSSRLSLHPSLNARLTRDEGGQPQVLKDYSNAAVHR